MAAPKSTVRVAHQKTPVTIVTGFLGAGKTTLLNYILKEKGNRSIAVIENEFGEVNIDTELVAENLLTKEDLVSLENGCVCCSLRKDIVKAFAEIERRSRQQQRRVDAIVLETTGLADPAPVAFTFFANPWLASRFRLDSIICVVDARYLMQHLEDGKHSDGTVNEAVQQIAFADLILLNKVDLVENEAAKRGVLSAIKSINNSARIIECQLNQPTGRPAMDLLLFNNLFSVNRVLEQVDPQFLDSDSEAEDSGNSSPHDHTQQPTSSLDLAQQHQHAAAPAAAVDSSAAAPDPPPPGPPAPPQHAAAAAAAATANSRMAGAPTAAVAATAASPPGAPSTSQDAVERSAGQTGTSTSGGSGSGKGPVSGSGGSAAANKLLRKYGIHRPHLAGLKHGRDDGLDCEDNCEECHIVEGMPIKGERNPKRRAKRLHDLSDVSSVGIMARGPLDEYRFNMYMRDLLAEKAKDIFRCKGVLSVHGYGSTKFVFQGVHETICYGPAEQPWKPDEPRINRVVFIGRGLDRKALIEGFRTCIWVPLPDGWDEFRDEHTKQPYYVNRQTGEKTWMRPEIACARVVATQGATQQPSQLLPKRQTSFMSAQLSGLLPTGVVPHLQPPHPQPQQTAVAAVNGPVTATAGGPGAAVTVSAATAAVGSSRAVEC